jgi:hypothetical protein
MKPDSHWFEDWRSLSAQGAGYYYWQITVLSQARKLVGIYTSEGSKFPQFRNKVERDRHV